MGGKRVRGSGEKRVLEAEMGSGGN